jgi:calmodulin
MDDISQKLNLYREAFELFDRDKDGCINPQELSEVMKKFYLTENFAEYNNSTSPSASPKRMLTDKMYKDIVDEVDVDGNEKIDFEEFVVLMHSRTNDSNTVKEDLQNSFKAFVEDPKADDKKIKNAKLIETLSSICDKMTKEEIEEIINEADSDKDGYLNYVEFTNFILDYK